MAMLVVHSPPYGSCVYDFCVVHPVCDRPVYISGIQIADRGRRHLVQVYGICLLDDQHSVAACIYHFYGAKPLSASTSGSRRFHWKPLVDPAGQQVGVHRVSFYGGYQQGIWFPV